MLRRMMKIDLRKKKKATSDLCLLRAGRAGGSGVEVECCHIFAVLLL